MITRTCPNCKKAWYSANDAEDWVCDSCGAKIPAKANVIRLCTLKDKFLCTPQNCEKHQSGKCDQDRYAAMEVPDEEGVIS